MKILMPVVVIFCELSTAVNPPFAQKWMQSSAPSDLWASVAMSADGTKLVAGVPLGLIYTSTNSGATWTSNNVPANYWASVASSADGMKLAAVPWAGLLYTSTNAGTTWMSNELPTNFWTSIASSADGNKLVALNLSGSVYTSTNSGVSWTSNSVPVDTEQWFFVNSSADGTKLKVTSDLGPIYVSTNSGMTWALATNAPNVPWQAVASSADGSKLVLAGLTNLIYTSSDSGITWKSNGVLGVTFWTGVTSSADGNKLVALGQNGPIHNYTMSSPIYTSTNSGVTWTEITNRPDTIYMSIVSSADGAKLVLIPGASYFYSIISVFAGDIYTSYSTPSPQLNIGPLNDNLTLSWFVPSTNFVLQQNSDLATANWLTLTNAPMLNLTNLLNEVILSPAAGNGFFRLKTQ
jgi:hypothetical protein